MKRSCDKRVIMGFESEETRESTPRQSWFDREVVEEDETDDEIFEDAILCVDPFNRR